LSENEITVVEFIKFVFGDSELAFAFGLEEILGSRDLENGITAGLCSTNQESDWFELLLKSAAWLL
jgi:hypothetical protein